MEFKDTEHKSTGDFPHSPAVHFLQEKAKTEKVQKYEPLSGMTWEARALLGWICDAYERGTGWMVTDAQRMWVSYLVGDGLIENSNEGWVPTQRGREVNAASYLDNQQGGKSAKTILAEKLQEKSERKGTKDYNGWANYVTWAAALHITNNQWSDDERYRILSSTYGQPISSTVAQIQSLFNRLYSSDPYLQGDMEGQDQNQIDWYEIANNWMADYVRDLPYSGKQTGKGEGVKTEEKAEKYTIDELSPREIQILDHIHDTPIWISDTGSTLDNYIQRDNGEMQHLASLGLISITGAVKQDNWGSFYQYVITAAGVAVLNGRDERA